MKKTLSLVLSLILALTAFVSIPVTASAAEITSVSFTPVEPIVFWYGYDTNIRQHPEYLIKDKVIGKGSVVTYHYSDGSSIDYIYNGYEYRTADGSGMMSGSSVKIDFTYGYTWKIGADNFIVLKVGNAKVHTVQVPVTVIEHPIASIEFIPDKPIEYYENIGGEFTRGSNSYYNYYVNELDVVFKKGSRLVVNYKDGTKSSFVYNSDGVSLIDVYGNKITTDDIELDSKQSTTHWKLGSNNYCEIKYKGISTYVPVTILESPVESISYSLSKPIELYENVDGYYDSYYQTVLYSYDATDDAVLTVKYKDGRTVPYYEKKASPYADGSKISMFFDEWGNMLPDNGYPTYRSQRMYEEWDIGTHYFKVSYMGATCSVPVTIVENPFSAMKVNLADYCIYERNTEEYSPYSFSLESHGNSVTFTYKTGGTVTYTYDGSKLGWFDQYGNEFKHRITWKQDNGSWITGQTYPVTVNFGDLSDTVYVTTVSNPIVSVDVALSKPIVVYENVNCRWNENLSCLTYNSTELLPDGTAIVFTYANGASKTYYYDKENRWLEDVNGVRIDDHHLYRFYLTQKNAFTLGNNYMFLEISKASLKSVVPVELKPQNEAPSYRLALVDGKWICMIGDIKAQYCNSLIEYYGDWYYINYGSLYSNYTGLYEYQGNYLYVKNGCVDWNYTGLCRYQNDFYYVENGVVNFNKTGLVYCWDEWYYVQNGWFNPHATTLALYDGDWYYVENGKINLNSNTLVLYNGDWYYVQNGWMNPYYTGLVEYAGDWYYVQNGWMNSSYTGLVEYAGDWYYVQNGWMNPYYTGLVEYAGDWYYVQNGWMNPYYTGLVEYAGDWYYVQNGWMNSSYTGLVEYAGDWYYVQNGWMNSSYTGLVEYAGDWYYVQNGWMNKYYTGVVEYEGAIHYVANGWVDSGYNGVVEQDGNIYKVENGVAHLFTKEEILALYQSAAQDIAQNGSAGYNKKSWQVSEGFTFSGTANIGKILEPIIKGFMTKEENAEVQDSEKDSDEAKRRMPMSNCTADTVESATIETKGDNYLITIVMKEQVNPEKTDTDGIAVMSQDILYASDVIEVIETENTIKTLIKQVNDLTLTYKAYTIQAEMTKEGEFVSITHIGEMDVTADANVPLGTTQCQSTITFNAVYSDFKY